ncbi:MAG: heavy metal translocating P-type ATPase [Microgenomates group bacterium]
MRNKVESASGGSNQTESFHVSGMHCASCASVIKGQLEDIDGIRSCTVNYATEKAQISFDPQKVALPQMNLAIDKLGYSLHSGHDMSPISTETAAKDQKQKDLDSMSRQLKIILPMVGISIFVMIWEIGANPFKLWTEMPDVLMEFFHHLLPIFATYSLFVVGLPYLLGISRFIKHRVANMDTLVGIGTLVAYSYSFIVTAFEKVLAPYLNTQQNYYDVTIVVIGFITLGKFLESRSKLKTGEAIEKLLDLQAKNALILRDGQEIEIPVDQVVLGDIMLVKPGTKIPLDGIIIEGKSSIDESMITGEPIPVDKGPKDSVIGSTINKQGSLQIKVSKIGADTMLSQIIKMVTEAQGSKAPIERLADQVSAIFVPIVLILSVVTLIAWMIAGQFTLGILCFVGILVIACPCAMGLATPTAIIVGVGKAAQNGILIKNAESLEKLNGVNFVVMDKTGTLTKGSPQVTDIEVVSTQSKNEVLRLLASLENHSEHPIAQAVVTQAKDEKLDLFKVTDFEIIEGQGLKGQIKSTQYLAGNLRLAADLKLSVDQKVIDRLATQGKTPIIFMTPKEIIGYVGISDTIKDDAIETVTALHRQNIKVAMLTGDNQITAEYIAKLVGIDRVIAQVLPGDKAKEIQKLQAEGYKVAMVGDGVNDAPALATADVGIAMGTGTDVAIESAGVTILGGHIGKIPTAVKLSHATMSIIKQNLFWAFFYNIIGIPIAAGLLYPYFKILLNPAIAGAAMGFSSVSVVTNSLRLKTKKF